MIRLMILSIITIFIFTSSSTKKESLNPDFSTSNNQLGYDIYYLLSKEKENFSFSPFSISTALAMTIKGANANTRKEMEGLLHLTSSEKIQKEYYNAYSGIIYSPQSLFIANGIWIEKSYAITQQFKTVIRNNFLAEIQNVDFKFEWERNRKEINKWIEEKTRKNIQNLLPPESINSTARVVLCNALYFNDQWSTPFNPDKTAIGDFKTDSATVKTSFMNREALSAYYEDENIKITGMDYKDTRMRMYIILPQENKKLEAIEEILTEQYISYCLKQTSMAMTTLSLPKFTADFDGSLKKILELLGMKEAFREDVANFSNMDSLNNLYISNVFHKSKVVVDEQGTVASAATGVVLNERSGPPKKVNFIVDRPFVFLLRSDDTNTNLFLGRIVNPNKK